MYVWYIYTWPEDFLFPKTAMGIAAEALYRNPALLSRKHVDGLSLQASRLGDSRVAEASL